MNTVNNEDYNLLKMISNNEKQSAKNSFKMKLNKRAAKSLMILSDNDSRFYLGCYSIIKGRDSTTQALMDHQEIINSDEDEKVIMKDIIKRNKYKKGAKRPSYEYKEYVISYKEV